MHISDSWSSGLHDSVCFGEEKGRVAQESVLFSPRFKLSREVY